MAIDRSFIERTDFSHDEHGYTPSEVEEHLRAIADAVEEMTSEISANPVSAAAAANVRQITESVASNVQSIIEAAELTAVEVRHKSEQDAGRVIEEARDEAQQIVDRAKTQADDVRRAVASARQLAERLGSGAMSLAVELEAVANSLPAPRGGDEPTEEANGGEVEGSSSSSSTDEEGLDDDDDDSAAGQGDFARGDPGQREVEDVLPSESEVSGEGEASAESAPPVGAREAMDDAETPDGEPRGDEPDYAPESGEGDGGSGERETVWVSRGDELAGDDEPPGQVTDPDDAGALPASENGEAQELKGDDEADRRGPKYRSQKIRLLAFNMAVRGTKMEDVKERLRDEFQLAETDSEALDLIVEEAFGKAVDWRLPLPHGRRRRFLSR